MSEHEPRCPFDRKKWNEGYDRIADYGTTISAAPAGIQTAVSLSDMLASMESLLPVADEAKKFVTTAEIKQFLLRKVKESASAEAAIFGIPILAYSTPAEARAAAICLQDLGEKVCLVTDEPAGAKPNRQ